MAIKGIVTIGITVISILSFISSLHYYLGNQNPTNKLNYRDEEIAKIEAKDLNILEEFKNSHSPLTRDPSWLKNCDSSMFQSLINGYPFEEYSVTTDDGYILKLFRIQAKGTQMVQTGKKPIYLQHCLVCSADDYVVNTEANALGLVLANKGYDVWLGNNRGNKYSLNHSTLSIYSEAFWDYSF